VREAIGTERIRIGPRIKKLRALLAKLDPASTERAVTPYPVPKPTRPPGGRRCDTRSRNTGISRKRHFIKL